MSIKRIGVLIAVLLALAALPACGSRPPDDADTTDISATTEEEKTPVQYSGVYMSGNYSMRLEVADDLTASVKVFRPVDGATMEEWAFSGRLDDDMTLQYTGGTFTVVKTDKDGKEKRSEKSKDGTGTIRLEHNEALWTSDADSDIRDLSFQYVAALQNE